MQIDVNNFFVTQVVPEIHAKNTYFKNRYMCIFVTDCIYFNNSTCERAKNLFGKSHSGVKKRSFGAL